MNDKIKIGSDEYCDIANDEAGIVCDENTDDAEEANALYEKTCAKLCDVESPTIWPDEATEDEIRSASRTEREWIIAELRNK